MRFLRKFRICSKLIYIFQINIEIIVQEEEVILLDEVQEGEAFLLVEVLVEVQGEEVPVVLEEEDIHVVQEEKDLKVLEIVVEVQEHLVEAQDQLVEVQFVLALVIALFQMVN